MGLPVEELTNLDGLELGAQLHRSNENVCFHAKFRGEPAVVKRLILSRADSLDKFEEEVRMLLRPEYREHMVVPLAIVRCPPHYSIVLPLMENGSLSTIMARNVLPLELIVCFAVDAARALAAFHKTGFVHRDIKSANILVDSAWRARLTDLGSVERAGELDDNGQIIRQITDTARLAQPSGGFHKSIMDGTTLGYTAPEVLRNSPAIQASDVYGLGMTFAEMLTGTPPYVGMEKEDADMHTVMDASYSEHALIMAICMDHLRPGLVTVSEKPGMPVELIDLIREMWHPNILTRPTAAAVVERLEAIATRAGFDLSSDNARQEYARHVEEVKQDGGQQGVNAKLMAEAMGMAPPPAGAQQGYQVHDVPTVPLTNPNGMDVDEDVEMTSGDASVSGAGNQVKSNSSVLVGAFATSGRRGADKMEDRHAVSHYSLGDGRGELSVITVFDGHGGPTCSHFANTYLGPRIGAQLAMGNFPDEAARRATVAREFVAVDEAFRKGPIADKSGCTALAAVVWQPEKAARPNHIRMLFANAGDCRAVLCRTENGVDRAVRLTQDHNAASASEQDRIRAAGGTIQMTRDGKLRVNGHIQVTRALGDAAMKPYGVTAEPEIFEYSFDATGGDDFIILATDGVWDTLSDEAACLAVRNTAKECGLAAKRIGGDALNAGSSDNISVVVIFLKNFNQHQDVIYV
ncbi:Protein kinase and PP2C-like domain-containing protein [Hondaea fermentalgiana]|uniref:Protein kinase and PP2C-like domain-containing protein n=1 Tax=Hondaea fermentalgiana TaxID=2315210 RepID=A0A2R5GM20_9STRA|nr:Protein kinase and PP2C-like domain-containing protein [Hondaea fermentalgiana]|eukprot:GBG31942.1 Protein kinase and PP2C-like domain-containing protein [Hondaea fermentalgiana]